MPGALLHSDITRLRDYFNEALDLLGLDCIYYQLQPGKSYTSSGELKANYFKGKKTKGIFDQVPTVSTLKKLGWVTELNMDAKPILHVRFDLPELQVGSLFSIRDPLNPTQGRLWKVTKMTVGILYPESVACQLAIIPGDDPQNVTNPYDGDKSIFLNQVQDPSKES